MKDYKRIKHMRNLNGSLIWERMKRCYDFGYEDGKADTPFTDTEEAEEKAYNRGLAEAWEAAKKIHDGQIPYEVFGLDKTGNGFTYASPLNWGETITVQETIAKIKEYEDKQKQDAEIKVGDEVIGEFGNKGIVITNVPSPLGDVSVWFSNQTHVQLYPVKNLSKTGRHFDQIAEVLAKLRGAENDEQ